MTSLTRAGTVGLLALSACGGSAARIEPVTTPTPERATPAESLRNWGPLDDLLDSAVADGAVPGAVVAVSYRGDHYIYGTGHLGQGTQFSARPGGNTVYDLASLTKVIGLTTAVMMAVDEGRLELDAPVRRYVPEFTGRGKDAVTIRQLLAHASGLPAWRELYRQARGRDAIMRLAAQTPLDTTPGTRYAYSDLGAIVLTRAVENVYHTRLDAFLAGRVFGPLGMESTRFLPPAEWKPRIAPTERDPWRRRMLHGEVHDENAAAMGGVSGHAGLFSTAGDLLVFGEWLLSGFTDAVCHSCSRISPAPPASLPTFVQRAGIVPGSSRALGWDTPSGNSSSGNFFAPTSIGHTGFTGTSIWIDPTRQLILVLLTNRVHPTRENQQHVPLRRAVADVVVGIVEKGQGIRER